MTPYFARFWIVMFVTAAIIFGCRLAGAQDADDQSPKEEQRTTIPNAQPAGPGDFAPGNMPNMWIGVKSCGVAVVWLVFDEHISVVDQDHHPKDMKEFMHALENSKIPHDERIIECTGASL